MKTKDTTKLDDLNDEPAIFSLLRILQLPDENDIGMAQINWMTEVNAELSTRSLIVSYILETLLQTDCYPKRSSQHSV